MLYSVFRQMVRFPKHSPERFSGIASGIASGQMAPSRSKRPLKFCVTGLALTLSLVAGGCATTAPEDVVVEPTPKAVPAEPKQTKPPIVTEPVEKAPVEAQPDGQATPNKPPVASSEMVTVSVYTIDDQCLDFVEQSVQVPGDKAMVEAVGKAIKSVDYNAFKLEGYQVNINGNTAIVDMKLSPSSQRQFVSLSSCEQQALFGSVEETLLNNSDWNVKSVKFMNAGKELIL